MQNIEKFIILREKAVMTAEITNVTLFKDEARSSFLPQAESSLKCSIWKEAGERGRATTFYSKVGKNCGR